MVPVKEVFENEHAFTGDSTRDYIAFFCRIYDGSSKAQLFLTPPCAENNVIDYLVRNSNSYQLALDNTSSISSRLWRCD